MFAQSLETGRCSGSDGSVTGITYAIYPPAGPRLPWLAVVLAGHKPLDMFGCADKETAERLRLLDNTGQIQFN